MFKAFNYIFYALFIGLMLAVAGLLVASMLPIPGNIELKIVKSGSMEPGIPTGSLVVVKPSANYSIGDVITFGADTRTQIPTTHRIIAYEADADGRSVYRTKGDANEDPDANPVQRSEVIGKVAFSLPYVGFILDFARQPLGFAFLVGIPAALVIMEEVFTIVRELKKALRQRRRKEEGKEDADDDSAGIGGGSGLKEVSRTERMVYLRKRAMDEIFVPMVVRTHSWMREKSPVMRKDAYASGTFVVVFLVSVSTMMAGGAQKTLAYFNDIERSLANTFAAANCDDFKVGSCDVFTIQLAPEDPSSARAVFIADAPEDEKPLEEEVKEEEIVEGEVLGTSHETKEEEEQKEESPPPTEEATEEPDVTPEKEESEEASPEEPAEQQPPPKTDIDDN